MSTPPAELPADASLSELTLRVRDLDPVERFYGDLLGLDVLERDPGHARLAPAEGAFTLSLVEAPEPPSKPPRTVGLFHWALLLPDRESLAAAIQRCHEHGARFTGFSDHGVSEAAYLSDPEGNGLELYRDRPADQWPTEGDQVAMVTDPLDLDDLLAAADAPAPLADGTTLGHVHLHVPDLDTAGRFYRSLGLRVRQSTYPGALFMAAGDYHHHVGLNTWAGDQPPPEGATGLVEYAWRLPEDTADAWHAAAADAAILEQDDGAWVATDPAGIDVRFEIA